MNCLLTSNANAGAITGEFFLTRVEYFGEKRQVVCEFQNKSERLNKRFAFFPKFFASIKGVSEEIVMEILRLYDEKRFRKQVRQGILCVQAATFSDLKKIARVLKQSLKLNALMLEPERQFLIEKNWSFFDCFKHSKNGFERIDFLKVPEGKIKHFSFGITETLEELIEKDGKTAVGFLEEIALSNVLKIPFSEVPRQNGTQAEAMIENFFFKNNFAIEKSSKAGNKEIQGRVKGFFKHLIELNFGNLWALLFTSEYYNLGFESLNCKCCKPESVFEKNILPNSRIQVRVLSEGFYFETASNSFAIEFHEENKGKTERLKRKREWFLQSLPVGPFEKNQKALIPVNDAVRLEEEGKVRMLEGKELKWHCLKKECFLSREVKALNENVLKAEAWISDSEIKALREFKVLGFLHSSRNLNHLHLLKFKEVLERILGEIPKQLLSSTSKNYSLELAESLKAVQNQKMQEFRTIGKANGLKVFRPNDYTVFVQGKSTLTALKEFSEKSRLNPAIKEVHKKIAF